jgi:hypothetical protein
VVLDHLETREEEQQGEAEVGHECNEIVDLCDPEHFGPDENAEDDLDDDGRQHEPQVPPREHGAECGREEDEDE